MNKVKDLIERANLATYKYTMEDKLLVKVEDLHTFKCEIERLQVKVKMQEELLQAKNQQINTLTGKLLKPYNEF